VSPPRPPRAALGGGAVTYLSRAGARAETRAANREAVACFEQALAALRQLPESRHTLEQAVDLRFELRRALFQLGETARTLAYLREAETLADHLGDPVRGGWARAQLGGHAWITGDHGGEGAPSEWALGADRPEARDQDSGIRGSPWDGPGLVATYSLRKPNSKRRSTSTKPVRLRTSTIVPGGTHRSIVSQ
jgi:hypothetical protein